ncbi:hypothetical protein OJ253_1293 [Cryptosporidium canis]|uniref:Uncharacterized protein n=1 Tax=Cryptosporidium canis TaxID=195482 RepID=A0A9D5DJK4_9CRYT|nr:hypothetical protein OJ253_1293 [Cryptosporidium canis]
MPSNQELDRICCISIWHKENSNVALHTEDLSDPRVTFPCSSGTRVSIGNANCQGKMLNSNEIISSGPIGRQRLKFFLETGIQTSQLNSLNMSNVSRTLSEWRKDNDIKNDFVLELIDFTKLCGVKKNKTYKDLFELLSKIFISKLRNKKIQDDLTYSKFDYLALRCVKMINIPHLVESVIALLTKFNRLSDTVIKELTTPDLYLFPRFLSFYKLAPIKLRQQMWLRRPRWFVYEIIPFIMLFIKILTSVDCHSILNIQNNTNEKTHPFSTIKDLLKFIQISKNNTNLKTEIDTFFLESFKSTCCDLSERKFSQQSNSIESIYTFISRIQSLYISCVELEYDNIELLGESCKCLAFNYMDPIDFYKSFIGLQKNELQLSNNSIYASIKASICPPNHGSSNQSKLNNSVNNLFNSHTSIPNGRPMDNSSNNLMDLSLSCSDTTICGNILRAGRVVAYISYCIGNYRELYIYFVNTLRQLYIDSLFHNTGVQLEQHEPILSINQNNTRHNTNSSDSNTVTDSCFDLFQPKFALKDTSVNKYSDKLPIDSMVVDESNKDVCNWSVKKHVFLNSESAQEDNAYASDDLKQKTSYRYEQKLNNFSGEPYLSSLRVFVALRIFHFGSKTNRTDEDEKKLLENEKLSANYNIESNSDKCYPADASNFDILSPLAISECDAVAWPCIHIVGNILRDGFSSNKSQESLVNISSTLIIKSKDDLSDISFIFSEPHFLFICSEFILETSILTMFHSSMDAMLVLNPQRRKIPIALISLGLNSPYLTFNNKNSILNNSGFLVNSVNISYSSGPSNSNNTNGQSTGDSTMMQASPFRRLIPTDITAQNSNLSISSRKRYRKSSFDAGYLHNIQSQQSSFAIRFDTLLNLLTCNNSQYEETSNTAIQGDRNISNDLKYTEFKNKMKHDTHIQQSSTCYNVPLGINNSILRLHNTIFSTFLPLIDRYLELSISSQGASINLQNNEQEKKKTRNEQLKSIRNELIHYINSISLSGNNYSDTLTIKFIRLISTSLFFTGVKPIIKQESTNNPLIRCNIYGLSYCHSHCSHVKDNLTVHSLISQMVTPSLPSCINLSIRLLETTFSTDWINKIFLKSIFGLLHTYPRVYNRYDSKHIKGESKEYREITGSTIGMNSLLASIPNDIIHGLLLRVIFPSTKDPSISSTEINTVHEIINDAEICSIIDSKTKKLFVERFWQRNPFYFNINFLQNENGSPGLISCQKIQFKDLLHHIQGKLGTVNTLFLGIEIPYKIMLWEHHFINSNDGYLLFQKWYSYFISTCKNHDRDSQYYSRILSLNKLLQNFIYEGNH